MKKTGLLFLFATMFSALSLQAQTPDQKIGDLLNKSDFFTLEEEYSLLKDSINPLLRVFSESMLGFSFNQPAQTCASVDSLIKNYQQDIGFANVQSMILVKAKSLAAMDEYAKAADELKGFMDAASAYMDSSHLKSYQESYAFFNKLRDVPKSELIRPSKDCTVSFQIDTIKDKSMLLLVPVSINGVQERFILDTGCPLGTFVSEKFAQKYNVRTVMDSLLISGTGTGYGRLGLIDSIQVGDMTYKNVTAIVFPPNQAVDTIYQIDAVLGLGIMKAAGELQIYPKEKKIVFPIQESLLPYTGRNMLFNADHPYLKTYSAGERLIMHFDTGNASSNLHARYYESHKEFVEKIGAKDTKTGGGFGSVKVQDIYRLPAFTLQVGNKSLEMKDLVVNVDPFWAKQGSEDGALGMSFITLFDKVTINFNKMFVAAE